MADKEKIMKKNNGQATNLTIEVAGTVYTMTRPGYYYGKIDGKQKRISKDEWDAAYEIWSHENEQAKSDAEAEKAMNKPKRSRKNAFFTSPSTGATLTEKQVSFILEMPNDNFYENGLDSALWIDVFCDTVAKTFNPMAVGAMVSTLREKGLIDVASDMVNGRRCKFMVFTELGKQVAKELGMK